MAITSAFIFSKQLLSLLYGQDCLGANVSFRILLLTLIIVFPSIIITNALFAGGESKKLVWFFVSGAIGNIIGDTALIPIYGIEGCAVATIISQLLSNSVYFFIITRFFSTPKNF